MNYQPSSLVDLLRRRSEKQSDQLIYRFLENGEDQQETISYQELDRRARAVGALLQSAAKTGDRALILYSPGLDFTVAFWGCLYAGIIAVPVYPPHPLRIEKSLPIVLRIAADAGPSVALVSTSLLEGIKARPAVHAKFRNIHLLATDKPGMDKWAGHWQQTPVQREDVAFLQYTSGSTTTPKGVILSHSNLLHNMDLIGKCFGVSETTHGVSWLPPYHDMGLIGCILQPVFSGISVTLMSHMMFLQRPLRWLQAISKFGGTINGAPNFAYELCVKKVSPEQKEQLDLSCWEVAFNGAEPVYHKTLDRFAEYFAPCGFRREAFLSCYGLAESTLLVVGGTLDKPPVVQQLDQAGLEQHRVKLLPRAEKAGLTLVSCGKNISTQEIKIVDVKTRAPCRPGQIGEIWLSGPCVAKGYWKQPEATARTFEARLSGKPDEKFLRSGDLGFIHGGELYITGRMKNLIISGGKNHYPHDIERTVEEAHAAIRPSGAAVFSLRRESREVVIVIAEIDHKSIVKEKEIKQAVQQAVALEHGLQVHDIRFVIPGSIPRTTSGKIRHFLCKKNYVSETLKEILAV